MRNDSSHILFPWHCNHFSFQSYSNPLANIARRIIAKKEERDSGGGGGWGHFFIMNHDGSSGKVIFRFCFANQQDPAVSRTWRLCDWYFTYPMFVPVRFYISAPTVEKIFLDFRKYFFRFCVVNSVWRDSTPQIFVVATNFCGGHRFLWWPQNFVVPAIDFLWYKLPSTFLSTTYTTSSPTSIQHLPATLPTILLPPPTIYNKPSATHLLNF